MSKQKSVTSMIIADMEAKPEDFEFVTTERLVNSNTGYILWVYHSTVEVTKPVEYKFSSWNMMRLRKAIRKLKSAQLAMFLRPKDGAE